MLIPKPKSILRSSGFLSLSSKSPLSTSSQPEAKAAAAYLSRRLGEICGWRPAKKGSLPGIHLELSPASKPLQLEAYSLDISPKAGVLIRSQTREGLLLGCQTLLNLALLNGRSRSLRLKAQSIHDAPAFGWRGVLIDSCRHFFSVKALKRIIDLLALHKFNRLHWHLTEDQGWRLEVKKYPRLSKVAAWRHWGSEKPYGGYYSNADVREIVRYAHEAGLVVVPEIEMPGHSTAALAAYPELSCRGGRFKVRSEWGVFHDIYCAGNEKTFKFLQGVLDEAMKLFPSPWIHLGADEAPKERWRSCPKCQKRIKDEGLKDEFALQTYFVGRMAAYLKKKGRTVVAWDEILEGGAPKGSLVQGWRGEGKDGPSARAAKLNRDTLVSPHTHWYLDHTNVGLKKTWSLNPIPPGLTKAQQKRVLGGECCAWSEGIEESTINRRLFPRMLAVSERLWRGWQGPAGYGEFKSRAAAQVKALKRLGVDHNEADMTH